MLPVVFIPGIFASVPLFGGMWTLGPSIWFYKPIIDSLKGAGLKVFIAYYEWWNPNRISARKRLASLVERALKATRQKKVILIAHSMGGIVARSYIQSDFYKDDVERLVMLSTPNLGSVNAYYPWEGGQSPPSAYEDFLDILLKSFLWIISRISGKPVTYSLIREYIPSIKELLPTEGFGSYLVEYLGNGMLPRFIPPDEMVEKNDYLSVLNNNVDIIKHRGIEVFCFNGTGLYTNKFIQVDRNFERDAGMWIDGKPVAEIRSKFGDGTVLSASSKFIFNNMSVEASHMGILNEVIPYLYDYLGIKAKNLKYTEEYPLKNMISFIVDKAGVKRKLIPDSFDVMGRFEWGFRNDEDISLRLRPVSRNMCIYVFNKWGSAETNLMQRDIKANHWDVKITNKKDQKPDIYIV